MTVSKTTETLAPTPLSGTNETLPIVAEMLRLLSCCAFACARATVCACVRACMRVSSGTIERETSRTKAQTSNLNMGSADCKEEQSDVLGN